MTDLSVHVYPTPNQSYMYYFIFSAHTIHVIQGHQHYFPSDTIQLMTLYKVAGCTWNRQRTMKDTWQRHTGILLYSVQVPHDDAHWLICRNLYGICRSNPIFRRPNIAMNRSHEFEIPDTSIATRSIVRWYRRPFDNLFENTICTMFA